MSTSYGLEHLEALLEVKSLSKASHLQIAQQNEHLLYLGIFELHINFWDRIFFEKRGELSSSTVDTAFCMVSFMAIGHTGAYGKGPNIALESKIMQQNIGDFSSSSWSPGLKNMLQTNVVFHCTNSKLQELKDTVYNVKEGAKGLPFASFQR